MVYPCHINKGDQFQPLYHTRIKMFIRETHSTIKIYLPFFPFKEAKNTTQVINL